MTRFGTAPGVSASIECAMATPRPAEPAFLIAGLGPPEEEFPGAVYIFRRDNVDSSPYRQLWTHPQLLQIVRPLLGSEKVSVHPVWNLRPTVPNTQTGFTPWHQDAAYFAQAWIPLLDAGIKEGCLQVIPGGHRAGRVSEHRGCWGETHAIYTEEADLNRDLGVSINDAVDVPVPYGGLLLFTNLLPHQSNPNTSDVMRYTVDIRWQRSEDENTYPFKPLLPIEEGREPDWAHWDAHDWMRHNFEVLCFKKFT